MTFEDELTRPCAIAEWFKSSGLLPFLTPFDPTSRATYLERYTAAVARACPAPAIMMCGPVLIQWLAAVGFGSD